MIEMCIKNKQRRAIQKRLKRLYKKEKCLFNEDNITTIVHDVLKTQAFEHFTRVYVYFNIDTTHYSLSKIYKDMTNKGKSIDYFYIDDNVIAVVL